MIHTESLRADKIDTIRSAAFLSAFLRLIPSRSTLMSSRSTFLRLIPSRSTLQTLQSEQQAGQGGRGWDGVGSTGPPHDASLSTAGGFRGPDATGGGGGLMAGEDSLSHAHPHPGQEIVSLGQPFGAPVDTILRVNMHVSHNVKVSF